MKRKRNRKKLKQKRIKEKKKYHDKDEGNKKEEENKKKPNERERESRKAKNFAGHKHAQEKSAKILNFQKEKKIMVVPIDATPPQILTI